MLTALSVEWKHIGLTSFVNTRIIHGLSPSRHGPFITIHPWSRQQKCVWIFLFKHALSLTGVLAGHARVAINQDEGYLNNYT